MSARTLMLASAACCVALALVPIAVRGQQPGAEERQRMVERMRDLNTPAGEHARLAALEGEWEQEVRIWPSPGAEPLVVRGAVTNRMILGGRFLQSEGSWVGGGMGEAGSLTLVGFDKRWSRYTIVGLDTWGTYYVTAAGPYDAASNAIVMHGTDEDPVLKHTQEYDMIVRFIDADTYVTEIVFTDEAHTKGKGPFRMVEVTHRRKG